MMFLKKFVIRLSECVNIVVALPESVQNQTEVSKYLDTKMRQFPLSCVSDRSGILLRSKRYKRRARRKYEIFE